VTAVDELDQVRAEAKALRPVSTNGAHAAADNLADEVEFRYQLLRSRLLTPDQLEKLPPPEPLIEGYCALNTLMTTFGRPGTAKTLLAMSMSFSLVTGQAWFGHAVKQGPVLYIVGEGTAGLGQRQRAWRETCGWPALDGMHWLPMALNLLDTTSVSALVRLVEELRPVLVNIDTVARSMPGGDENSSTDMGALVAASDRIREASQCTVNLIHHTPREGSTPRGHSALEGAVDSAVLLERSGGQITLSCHKQKDLPEVPPMVFELMQVGSSVVPTLPNRRGSVADLVGAEFTVRNLIWECCGSDGLAPSTLLKMSGLPPSSFYRALKSLREQHIVRNVGTESRTRYVGADEVEPATLPTLPNTPMGAAQHSTPNNPPYRGLEGESESGSDGVLDLDEALFDDCSTDGEEQR